MFRHVGIVVNDLNKMLWFYQDIIGLEILYDKIDLILLINLQELLNWVGKIKL
jgi:catechol 2,3-dioxygenase-like lactoylglutathione lyase family enzyme